MTKDLHNLESFESVCSYYFGVFHGTEFTIKRLESFEWGVACFGTIERFGDHVSLYLYPQYRGMGLYKKIALPLGFPVVTADKCNLETYLKHKGIPYRIIEPLVFVDGACVVCNGIVPCGCTCPRMEIPAGKLEELRSKYGTENP